jgi:hypothetical protein
MIRDGLYLASPERLRSTTVFPAENAHKRLSLVKINPQLVGTFTASSTSQRLAILPSTTLP